MKTFLILIQFLVLTAGYAIFFNQWVTPNDFPYFNLLALGFPVILFVNILILMIWWFSRWKLALFFTILSLPLLLTVNKTYHIYGEPETKKSNLKLATYNVKYFFDDRGGLSNYLKQQEPDVVFFQEMGAQPEWVVDQIGDYNFLNFNSLGILSKYPVVEAKDYRVRKDIRVAFSYADVKVKDDTVRLVNFYLESLHIDQKIVKESAKNLNVKGQGASLIRKINKASKVHQEQIKALRETIANSPYPVIVAGDMNAVPASYEYFTISRGLKDAFILGGQGLGSTFPGFRLPLRLDYVFVSPEIKVKSYQIKKVDYSDHYPVITELEIPQ